MLAGFFLHLKSFRLPVSTREFLTLLEALEQRVVTTSLDDFHTLARACLVKDEQHFDRFDLAFGSYFKGVDTLFDVRAGIPEDWLRREFLRHLTDEVPADIVRLDPSDLHLPRLRYNYPEPYSPAEFKRTHDFMVAWGLIKPESTFDKLVDVRVAV